MDTFMGDAIVLEAVLASVLLALWLTWLLMSGLLRLLPVTSTATPNRRVRPIRFVLDRRHQERSQRDAA